MPARTIRMARGPSEETEEAQAPVESGPVSIVSPQARYRNAETNEPQFSDQAGWMEAVNVGSEVSALDMVGHPVGVGVYGLYKGLTGDPYLDMSGAGSLGEYEEVLKDMMGVGMGNILNDARIGQAYDGDITEMGEHDIEDLDLGEELIRENIHYHQNLDCRYT